MEIIFTFIAFSVLFVVARKASRSQCSVQKEIEAYELVPENTHNKLSKELKVKQLLESDSPPYLQQQEDAIMARKVVSKAMSGKRGKKARQGNGKYTKRPNPGSDGVISKTYKKPYRGQGK